MLTRCLCAAVGLWGPCALAQTIYVWTDPDGEDHYTDDRSTIPKGVKARTTVGEEPVLITTQPSVRPQTPAAQPTSTAAEPLTTPPRPPEPVAAPKGPPRVFLARVATEVSEVDRQYIEQCIASASASERLAAWGGLTESVGVEIHPRAVMQASDGGDAFGLALGRSTVRLRAPKDTASWGQPLPYERTMLHELGHILEHQHADERRPRWFAEGFANHVADFTGYASKEDVAWWTIRKGGQAPLDAAFPRAKQPVAYAIATEAVRFLIELVGEDGLKRLFALRKAGTPFEEAFSQVAGLSVAEFQRRFIERVRPSYHDRAE